MVFKKYYIIIIIICLISTVVCFRLFDTSSNYKYYDKSESTTYSKITENLSTIIQDNNWNDFLFNIADYIEYNTFQISIYSNFFINFSEDKINYLNMYLLCNNNELSLYRIFYDDTNNTKELIITKLDNTKIDENTICIQADYLFNLFSKMELQSFCQGLDNSSQFDLRIEKKTGGYTIKNLENVKLWRITDSNIIALEGNQYLHYNNSLVALSIWDSFGKNNLLILDELSY
ncbi:hypothetical protein [Abyssisolibacter fermentans]|uniref:hypothetical protein n=1 Tax=Abyssisolibacter fermentans TaxID=1766203 RepID=UPI00082B66A8|nr:hypothetical protein [Abyssisolibacter fermentans]